MSEENTYKYDNWAVDVDNGEFWHECYKTAFWPLEKPEGRMYRDCHKRIYQCHDCDVIAPKETINKLYIAWRMFHIRDKKSYTNGIEFTGLSFQARGMNFYLNTSTLNNEYAKLQAPKIAIPSKDFNKMFKKELARQHETL